MTQRKGIILAGGYGTRIHLLLQYQHYYQFMINMIYYR